MCTRHRAESIVFIWTLTCIAEVRSASILAYEPWTSEASTVWNAFIHVVDLSKKCDYSLSPMFVWCVLLFGIVKKILGPKGVVKGVIFLTCLKCLFDFPGYSI